MFDESGVLVFTGSGVFILMTLILVLTCGEAVRHGLSLSLIVQSKDADRVLRQGGEVS